MEQEKYPSDSAAKFMVRLPEGMRDRIAEAAKANGRSMNSEVVARLEASFNMDLADEATQLKIVELVNAAFDARLKREKDLVSRLSKKKP